MRKKGLIAVLLTFILITANLAYAKINIKTLAEEIILMRNTHKTLPHISARYPDFNPDKAYLVQKLVVNKLIETHKAKVSGFKAAFTDPVSQKNFGMTEPAYGVLLNYMVLEEKGTPLNITITKKAIRPMLEVEIGFVIKKDITKPIKDLKELKNYIKSAFIAVEIPDIRFDLNGLKGSDLIADDAGTFLTIKGKEFDPFKLDLSKIQAKLYKDGKIISMGSGKNVLGNPLNSLLWVVNKAISLGEKVKKGDIIITGTMTRMVPAQPGKYVALCEGIGTLKFNLK
ncbi:MAG: hypothetical protein NZ900_02640 [Synergistetes bacterium]|nr:hypothetical protein [Synergistota bacterium]MDW8191826.1 hypothetical protein [Synergistota bacterium]